jgi:acetyl-CoA carboxylase carboxyltransferase component
MDIIKRDAAARQGAPVDESQLAQARKGLEEQIERESDCYFATGRLWDDGIIDPRQTRTVVAICLAAAHNRTIRGTTRWGVFRH